MRHRSVPSTGKTKLPIGCMALDPRVQKLDSSAIRAHVFWCVVVLVQFELTNNFRGWTLALLSQEGSGIAMSFRDAARGGSPSKSHGDAASEPPPARSRLSLDRAALLTQEGKRP